MANFTRQGQHFIKLQFWLITYETDKPAGNVATPIVANIAGTNYYWEFDKEALVQSDNTPNHTWVQTGIKSVKLHVSPYVNWPGTTLDFQAENIVGDLNASNVVNLQGFNASHNDLMTSVLFPESSTSPSQGSISIENCDLIDGIDLSWMTNPVGQLSIRINPINSSITFPNTPTGAVTVTSCINSPLLQSIDVSGVPYAANWNFQCSNCTIANPITFGTHANSCGVMFASACQEVLIYDFSGFTISSTTAIRINSCIKLNLVTMPTVWNSAGIYFSDCFALPTLDLSGGALTGIIFGRFCTVLSSISFPSNNTGLTTNINIQRCRLLTTVNISGFKSHSGSLVLAEMDAMATVLMPTYTADATVTTFRNSFSLTALDLMRFGVHFTGSFDLFGLTAVTIIIWPLSAPGIVTQIILSQTPVGYQDFSFMTGANDGIDMVLSNMGLNATEVNQYLEFFDNSGWINGSIDLGGNAAPDSTSGGIDGIAAIASLNAKGWITITT